MRPTRKQNVIGNARGPGNAKSGVTEKNVVWNPNDRPKTTIKEQTENTHSNKPGVVGQSMADTQLTLINLFMDKETPQHVHLLVIRPQQKSTGAGFPTYNSAYGAQQNYNKEKISKVDRYNIGNTNQLNTEMNLTTYANKASEPECYASKYAQIIFKYVCFGEIFKS